VHDILPELGRRLIWQYGRGARRLNDFISIGGVFADPHGNPKAMHDRIIVGRKGSGKTFYLRKLQDEAISRKFLTLVAAIDLTPRGCRPRF
jgi:hypothetical protein